MEKLSSILPSSSRVASVDLDEAPPARPGAPAFGRKVGRNTVSDRVTLSKQAKEMAAQDTLMGKNPKEVARSKMVDEVNKKFFETRLKPIEKESPRTEEIAEQVFEAPEVEMAAEEAISAYEPKVQKSPRLSIEV